MRITRKAVDTILSQLSEANHEDAKGDEVNSIDEAFHSGFASAILVLRIAIREFDDDETN